jgi:protein phosphatase
MRIGRYAALTDTGRRRLQNEDSHVVEPPLFAVADGMGGAQAGEIASRIAAGAIEEGAPSDHGESGVERLVQEANARIFARALGDPATAGMGTTATVALVDEIAARLAIGHVGDSRMYRVRGERLEQLTPDHSLVGELVRSGRLTPEEADAHPHRSVITRAVGTEADVEVDTMTVPLEIGDLFLLCSDGLTDMLRDDEILSIVLESGKDPVRAAALLVAAANDVGGDDNITVVLFEIDDGVPDPLEITAEQPVVEVADTMPAPAAAPPSVRRWGAGAGSRWPALLTIAAALVLALALVWSFTR